DGRADGGEGEGRDREEDGADVRARGRARRLQPHCQRDDAEQREDARLPRSNRVPSERADSGSHRAGAPCSATSLLPTAKLSTLSSLEPPGSSPTRRPSEITRMRSLSARISGRSEEITSIPSPCCARPSISLWISPFAPTSTPRVGSSRISTFGSVASHFASTTFCWLPPLSWLTGCTTLLALTSSRRNHSAAINRSFRRRSQPSRATIEVSRIDMFW